MAGLINLLISTATTGLKPNCVLLVCTARALKMHGGGPPVTAVRIQ